jgi:hypothetical protein
MIKNNKTLDWVIKELLKGNKIKNDILQRSKLTENYSLNKFGRSV